MGGAQDNGSWKIRSGTTWDKGTGHRIFTYVVDGGDGGYTAIDFTTPSRYYTSNTGTTITRHDSRGNSPILSSGQIGGSFLVLPAKLFKGAGSFINPFIMDPSNSKVLYTCNEKVWTTNDATASSVQWTSIG